MKIDWKEVSKSPGYISLKRAYIEHAKNSLDKKRSYEVFTKVIGMAKSVAHKENRSLVSVLDEWENTRKCDYVNYYTHVDNRLKSVKNKTKLRTPTYLKKIYPNNPRYVSKRIREEKSKQAKFERLKLSKKPRWTSMKREYVRQTLERKMA